MKINKQDILAAVIAFALIVTGVVVSSKKKDMEFSRNNFRSDLKTRNKVARYIVKHKTLQAPDVCKKYSVPVDSAKNTHTCVRYLLGDPYKSTDNKLVYTVLSDEIVLWRKYLVVEFNKDNTEVTNVTLQHFL